ncbi:hypothetical protein, partial [Sediminivirga luteola]|uniref:hypothetical protein n=1 Tax=Sediminivirga luteola TaxID=1774748 RepID=UPI001F1CF6AC
MGIEEIVRYGNVLLIPTFPVPRFIPGHQKDEFLNAAASPAVLRQAHRRLHVQPATSVDFTGSSDFWWGAGLAA